LFASFYFTLFFPPMKLPLEHLHFSFSSAPEAVGVSSELKLHIMCNKKMYEKILPKKLCCTYGTVAGTTPPVFTYQEK